MSEQSLPPNQHLAAPGKWPAVGEKSPRVSDEPWAVTVDGLIDRGADIKAESVVEACSLFIGEERKGAQGWQETVRPYEAQIRASGGDPQKYVGELLQTAHALSYGPTEQKADLLANLIMQFRVPPEMLDQALVARMGGQGAPRAQAQGQQFQDPRVDQLLQQLESTKREQTTRAAAEADQSASAFADTHEFFDDVAGDVANLLDVWAKQGKTQVSTEELERAYEIACQMNPDVSPVYAQRQAHSAARTAQATTQRARIAASSVRSQPTAAQAAQPTGRRAALEAAFDELDQ